MVLYLLRADRVFLLCVLDKEDDLDKEDNELVPKGMDLKKGIRFKERRAKTSGCEGNGNSVERRSVW